MLTVLVALTTLGVLADGQAPRAPDPLSFSAPANWKTRPNSSSMRVVEFVVPRAVGDADDGELVLYYFGGGGGNVEANVQRWLGQMQQPRGRASGDVARRETRTVNGLKITMLDVSGTYVAEVRPGSQERHHKPGYRMRTAVIETPRGPYFIKLVGPAKTIAAADQAFAGFVSSLRFQQ